MIMLKAPFKSGDIVVILERSELLSIIFHEDATDKFIAQFKGVRFTVVDNVWGTTVHIGGIFDHSKPTNEWQLVTTPMVVLGERHLLPPAAWFKKETK